MQVSRVGGINEGEVDIPIGTVMIDLGDFQVVLGGKGRWCHPNGNSKVLRDCPNHNLSWI
jgi:hypothetical protein